MRRDLFYYYEANIASVYQAYLHAATNKPFERDCKQEPFHTISFGVNFSFKYNMNGGACILHFMPCGTGTAVNIHFSIAQAVGARYEKYAQDLNAAVQNIFPVLPQKANFNADDFTREENKVHSIPAQPAPPFVPSPAPTPTAQPATDAATLFCSNCGQQLTAGSNFCNQCGTKVAQEKYCPSCGKKITKGSNFCGNCGAKL